MSACSSMMTRGAVGLMMVLNVLGPPGIRNRCGNEETLCHVERKVFMSNPVARWPAAPWQVLRNKHPDQSERMT